MIPVSATFDIADWTPNFAHATGASAIGDITKGILSSAAKRGAVDIISGNLAIASPGANIFSVSSLSLTSVVLGEVYTLEFSFQFPSVDGVRLVPTASREAGYVRFVLDSVSYPSIELYLTEDGLFISGASGRGATLVAGSRPYVDDGSVIRLVVDHGIGNVAVYAGDKDCYVKNDGAWFDYPNLTRLSSLKIKPSWPTATGAGLQVQTAAAEELGHAIVCGISSVRIASTAVLSTAKPIASITTRDVITVGSVLSLYGNADTDISSFKWNFERVPTSSRPHMDGGEYSSLLIDSDTGGVRIRFFEETSRGDEWYVNVVKARGGASLSLSVNSITKKATVRLATDVDGTVLTTVAEFAAAVNDPANPLFNPEFSNLFVVDVAATNDNDTLAVASGFLTGGSSSTRRNTTAILDVPGAYVISLRVEKNGIWSDKALYTVVAQLTDQLLGAVPDTSIMLQYIRDFWKNVDDIDQVETIWAGTTRLVGAALSELWQIDLAKSLPSIPSKFSRKWLGFKNFVDVQETQLIITDEKDAITDYSGHEVGVRTVNSIPCADSYFYENDVVIVFTDVAPPSICTVARTEAGRIYFKTGAVTVAVQYAQVNSRYVDSSTLYIPAGLDTKVLGDLYVELSSASRSKLLRVLDYSDSTRFLTVDGTVIAPESDGSVSLTSVGVTSRTRVLETFRFNVGLTAEIGDIAHIRVVNNTIGVSTNVTVTILAANNLATFVDMDELRLAYAAAAKAVGEDETIDFGTTSFTLIGAQSYKNIGSMPELVSAPYLGSTKEPQLLSENFDFIISDNNIVANDSSRDIHTHTSSVLTSDSTITSTATFGRFGDILIETGLNPGLKSAAVRKNGSVLLGSPCLSSKVRAAFTRFTAARPPRSEYFSELTYFSNDALLEDNFGVLVGLTRAQHAEFDVKASYSGAVKGLWTAYMHGPSISALSSAIQIILGLPYTSKAGHVVEIVESEDPQKDGYIVIESEQDLLTVRLPYGMALGLNPNTGRRIKATFSASEKTDDWYDSEVPAFCSLVDVVSILDAVNSPSVLGVGHETRRAPINTHVFVIRIPLNIVSAGEVTELIRTYVREAKPAYTDFIVIGTLLASDSVAIADELRNRITVHKQDTMYFPQFRGTSEDDAAARSDVEVPTDATYPLSGTTERYPADVWGVTDAKERFHAGYAVSVLNDYPGDGGWNPIRKVVDIPNRFTDELDVTASTVWLPVEITPGVDFMLGEFITVTSSPELLLNSSRPYIRHIGCGEHPRIPFGVLSPQQTRPKTYFILGFDEYDPTTGRCDGVEERLTCLSALEGEITLTGVTSGATATVMVNPVLGTDDIFFRLEYLLRSDLALDMCPRDTVYITVSTYISNGNISYDDIRAVGGAFNDDPVAQLRPESHPTGSDLDVFKAPIPVYGLYTVPANRDGSDLVEYDVEWTDLNSVNEIFYGDFSVMMAQEPLKNICLGYSFTSDTKGNRLLGRECRRAILTPAIYSIEYNGFSVTLYGSGFLDEDSTHEGMISETAYNGSYGTSWVFFENESGSFPADSMTFWLGSPSHILTANIPNGIVPGVYNVRVANIRPYQAVVGEDPVTHVDSFVLESAVTIGAFVNPFSSGGVGALPFGSGSVGG